MYQSEQKAILVFRFESFPADGFLQHGILGRQGGVSVAPWASLNLSLAVKDTREHVAENRRRAYGIFGRNFDTLVHAHLTHGAHVARVTRAQHGQAITQADGLITNDPGCGLTMNFADCAPILVYDPLRHAIGLGHAGWKGALADLPGNLVRAMQAEFGSHPADLLAAIGPCIGVRRYEIGEPVISAVRQAFSAAADRLLVYPGEPTGPALADRRLHFDLPQANRLNLERAGVQRIEVASWCTATHTDLFFSHRAEQGQTGRFGAVLALGDG